MAKILIHEGRAVQLAVSEFPVAAPFKWLTAPGGFTEADFNEPWTTVTETQVLYDATLKSQILTQRQAAIDAAITAAQAEATQRAQIKQRIANYETAIDAAATMADIKTVLKNIVRDLGRLADRTL